MVDGTVVATGIKALLKDGDGKVLLATGTTVPTNGGSKYAKGCIFIDTAAATGSKALYENKGTSSSCIFDAIGDIAAAEITLAEGSILVGNASGVATALDAKTTTRILVGNGTTITSVAISSDATMANTGALTIANGAVTRTKMSTAAASKVVQVNATTIATSAGNNYLYVTVPENGTLAEADFAGVDALATNDTNYITFTITNLTQAGAGTTVMLAASDANTTKATGGTAIVANGRRTLTLTGTGADLAVAKGDRLRINAAVTGTLANAVANPTFCLRFSGTT